MARKSRDRSRSWSLPLASALAEALHGAGAPAQVVEAEVRRVLGARGVASTVMATPTALWVQAGDRTTLLRLAPAGPDLGRLQHVTAVADAVAAGHLGPRAATRALQRVPARPWPAPLEGLAFAVAAAGAAVLLGGAGADAAVAAVLGLLVWGATGWAGRRPGLAPFTSGAAASVAGLGAALAAPLGARPALVALAAVVVLAPGLQLVVGTAELVAGHWSAGSARLAGAAPALVQLAAGLAVGLALASPGPELASAHPAAALVAVPLTGLAIGVLLQVRARHLLPVAGTVVAAWAAAQVLAGPAGAGLGALVAAVAGNAASRWRGVAPSVLTVPGILLLVPGSVGVQGVGALMADALLPGLQSAVSAALAAAAIAAGLLLGNALLPPASGGDR